jgi:uncharacterized protein YciI
MLKIFFGPQRPRSGGAIIAKGQSKAELQKIMLLDPFVINNLVTLDIIEFTPIKYSDFFRQIL